MTLDELYEKYKQVPNELKVLKRWVCWNLETRDGKKTKVPINSLNGKYARCNDPLTWSKFEITLKGCIKYNCTGIGFMLGDGIVGIDLDNHIIEETGELEIPVGEFESLSKEFIETMNSYTELSQSGVGIHIIAYGELPEGRRRTKTIEMYDKARFFAFTGNVIKNTSINERKEELLSLWKKHLEEKDIPTQVANTYTFNPNERIKVDLSDQELIDKIKKSKQGYEFTRLYNGDMTSYNDDHSAADMGLCCILAFWCNGDKNQIDRIFRTSALMRNKWDEKRGANTYGNITIDRAVKMTPNGYTPTVAISQDEIVIKNKVSKSTNEEVKDFTDSNLMNIDKNGDPIFRIKKIYKSYELNDTGNAQKFYDYFGYLFKYNKTDKKFMFWTGKTWILDEKDIIRKYANKLLEILSDEQKDIQDKISQHFSLGELEEGNRLSKFLEAHIKNRTRLANKSGKEAMISELQSIYDIPIVTGDLDTQKYLLNTDSGVVNLETGELMPFDSKLLLSQNTNVKVCYDEPTEWLKFLKEIFKRPNPRETEEIIDCLQQCVGYSLTASTSEQCIFFLYGNGSNGKSTFIEQLQKIMGTYATTTPAQTLMQQKSQNNSTTYSIAKLKGTRFVSTGETEKGEKLAEATVKLLTGGDTLSAAFKYGNEFDFKATFKIWMATNNRPIIVGDDNGIWRRIFPFPFLRKFTDEEKDTKLPEKLEEENDKILGWAIKGFLKFQEKGVLLKPKCLQQEVQNYKDELDVVARFFELNCQALEGASVSCRTLYHHYKCWCQDNNDHIYRERDFCKRLKNKGFNVERVNEELCYIGLKLFNENAYSNTTFGKQWLRIGSKIV